MALKPLQNNKVKSVPVKQDKKEVKSKPKAVVDPEIVKLLNEINKKHGKNAVALGASFYEDEKHLEIEKIPTGNISLDISLGGGIPVGRFTHICGAESSTKTTQSLHILREAQNMGLMCSMQDVEGTTDNDYLEHIGVNTSTLLYSRPDGLEETTQLILDYQKSGIVHLALWDSLEATPPTKEMDSDMDETVRMGIKQQLLGEFFRKYQAQNNRLVREGKRPFTLIVTNQLREKIGAYGDPEYSPGGKAKDFAKSVDIKLRRGDWIKSGKGEDQEIVGQVVKYKIEKNKKYKRMQTGEFDFYTSRDNDAGVIEGFNDNVKSVIVEAVAWDLIKRGGAWFYYGNDKFNGQKELINFLRDNDKVVQKLRSTIIDLAKKG